MVKGKEFQHRKGSKSTMEKSVEMQTCGNCGYLYPLGDVECPRCHVKPSIFARRYEKFTRSE